MATKHNVVMVDLGTGMGRELLPLSLGYVTSYANSIQEVSNAFSFYVHFLDRNFDAVVRNWPNPAIVAIAFYGWNKTASLRMVQTVKHYYPESIVILGGPSVPMHQLRIEEFIAKNPYVDILVHGEGEVTFADLLMKIKADEDLSSVQGITYRCPDISPGYTTNPARQRIIDLNIIPSPYLNGFFDDILQRYGNRVTGTVFETNRGCPFHCTFCDWGSSTMSKMRQFELTRVLEEIEWMSRNKIFYAYGADSNFGIFSERDLKIADKFAEMHIKTGYPGYLRLCWTKNSSEKIIAISDRLSNSGVGTMVTLSVQSYNLKTLDAIKRKNIRHEDLMKLKSKFHERRMQTYTEVILGLPEETYESFRDGLTRTMTTWIEDLINIYPCSMIENSEMASPESRKKFKIETRFCYASALRTAKAKKWDMSSDFNYEEAEEVDEIIVGTSTMSVKQWQQSFIYGHFVWAMYFYRLAFFLMNYLHKQFDIKHSDFLEFVIKEVADNSALYPQIEKGLFHLRLQSENILNSHSMTLPLDGFGDRAFQPNEAVMTIFLEDANKFYHELLSLTEIFGSRFGHIIPYDILAEVIYYQKLRIPTFPKPDKTIHHFVYNIPEYFAEMIKNGNVPVIKKNRTILEVILPENFGEKRTTFAISRVDKGITLKLNDIKIIQMEGRLSGSSSN
jgi:radical SAM superfamily enzyme YgiQ (UPF0313 family)